MHVHAMDGQEEICPAFFPAIHYSCPLKDELPFNASMINIFALVHHAL